MIHVIDSHRLNILHETPLKYACSTNLRREGRVFFIGGDLPVYSTLETMYESYCLESTELFHVTFGDAGAFEQNLEMVRQIKRNFSIRLMARCAPSGPAYTRWTGCTPLTTASSTVLRVSTAQ